MPGKDIKQINDVAKEYGMNPKQRKRFGKFLELEKKTGNQESKKKQGDFTYQELRQKAREFLGL